MADQHEQLVTLIDRLGRHAKPASIKQQRELAD
jgi:hypothetical protein